MTQFIQLHLLTSYPAANLNRDDLGRPKTLVYGGAERIRISSQSLKRAIRGSEAFATAVGPALGVRTQGFAAKLVSELEARGLDHNQAVARVEAVIEHDRIGKVSRGKARTEQLVHLGPDEQARLSALADDLAAGPPKAMREALVLLQAPRAADIAMFGRMLADNPRFNVDAAVQVAHAFTTHRGVVEDDYYTAVDDLSDSQTASAAFMGVSQFSSGLFYGYVCVDADLLRRNLANDRGLAAAAVEGLVAAAMTVSPRGRQGSFASRARASFALVEVGDEAPRTLASAFQHPVGERPGETDQLAASIARLRDLKADFSRVYGERFAAEAELDLGAAGSATLAELMQTARSPFDPSERGG